MFTSENFLANNLLSDPKLPILCISNLQIRREPFGPYLCHHQQQLREEEAEAAGGVWTLKLQSQAVGQVLHQHTLILVSTSKLLPEISNIILVTKING